jgi:hypothetical protein
MFLIWFSQCFPLMTKLGAPDGNELHYSMNTLYNSHIFWRIFSSTKFLNSDKTITWIRLAKDESDFCKIEFAV